MAADVQSPEGDGDSSARPWFLTLNRYHWLVLVVCTLGWLFDCLDQQLFNLARKPAISELLQIAPTDPLGDKFGGWATSLLMIGWATGGIIFGIMGDRVGRARTMVWTILIYSVFTGLSGFAFTIWDFLLYRFLAGLGIGGQFGIGVTLVAESLPDRVRPRALGALQAFSAVGNVGAGAISLGMISLQDHGVIDSFWRMMFAVGIIPSFLVIFVIRKLKEPESWKKAVSERTNGTRPGSVAELFGDPRWRSRAIVGMLLASAGVIGLWGIGVFSADLNQMVFRSNYEQEYRDQGEAARDLDFAVQVVALPEQLAVAEKQIQPSQLLGADKQDHDAQMLFAAAVELHRQESAVSPSAILARLDADNGKRLAQTPAERSRRAALLASVAPSSAAIEAHRERIVARQKTIGMSVARWAAVTLMLFNIGAFVGIYIFARVTPWLGRRPTFALGFLAAMVSTAYAFWSMRTPADIYWMVPLMGCCQLSVFGGYAIYFPELFPTRLRSTGTSFCYNIGRYVAAGGPATLGWLSSDVFRNVADPADRLRYAGVSMCACFLVGLVALIFAPETQGKPLPE